MNSITHCVFDALAQGRHHLAWHPESRAWVERRFAGDAAAANT